jgi:hypothetical protein
MIAWIARPDALIAARGLNIREKNRKKNPKKK